MECKDQIISESKEQIFHRYRGLENLSPQLDNKYI